MRLIGRLLVVLLLAAAPAAAQTPDLVGTWTGRFVWDEEPDDPQEVQFTFERREAGPNGTLRFTGPGLYRVDPPIRVTAIADLDPRSGELIIIETEADQPDAETNGAHRGRLSADGQSIEAEWTSKGDGARARLTLRRSGGGK